MEQIPGWRTQTVSVVRSNAGTLALKDYRDNFLVPTQGHWPPPEIAQKLFQSSKLDYFPTDEHAELTAGLGHYCDLQSLHSEDALTWNAFGYLGQQSAEQQGLFASQLLAHLGIVEPVTQAHTWVWRRLPHPETLGGNGPELDFGIHAGHTLVLGESKWHGSVSQGQGLAKDKNQIQIRMEFLSGSGRLLFPDVRRFILLGATIPGTLLEEVCSQSSGIQIRQTNLRWEDLGDLLPKGHSEAFKAYHAWKVQYGRAHLSDLALLDKLELRVPSRVQLLGPSQALLDALGTPPHGLELLDKDAGRIDTVVAFASSLAEIEPMVRRGLASLREGGKIWICWPLRASDLRSDLDQEAVFSVGERCGLVRIKAARIDRNWTSYKFYRRKQEG